MDKKEVTYGPLQPGDRFRYKGVIYMKVEGLAPRQQEYAVNMNTYCLEYFYPNSPYEMEECLDKEE